MSSSYNFTGTITAFYIPKQSANLILPYHKNVFLRASKKKEKKWQHLKHVTGVCKLVAKKKKKNSTPLNCKFSYLGFGMEVEGGCGDRVRVQIVCAASICTEAGKPQLALGPGKQDLPGMLPSTGEAASAGR